MVYAIASLAPANFAQSSAHVPAQRDLIRPRVQARNRNCLRQSQFILSPAGSAHTSPGPQGRLDVRTSVGPVLSVGVQRLRIPRSSSQPCPPRPLPVRVDRVVRCLSLLGAGETPSHETEEGGAGRFDPAGKVGTDPGSKLFHGLAAFGRWVGNAELSAVLVQAIRLKYALGKAVAEIKSSKVRFAIRACGACRGKIVGSSDTNRCPIR